MKHAYCCESGCRYHAPQREDSSQGVCQVDGEQVAVKIEGCLAQALMGIVPTIDSAELACDQYPIQSRHR